MPFRRFGIQTEIEGVPILKPHGSIDFDIVGIEASVEYPLEVAALRNDFPVKVLKSTQLLSSRTEADIILPHEYSYQLNYQWIRPVYKWVKDNAQSISHCVIIGLSYWMCDRPEIDYLLDCLSYRTKKIIIANPHHPVDLKIRVKEKFGKVKLWKNGPKELVNVT